MNVKTTFAIAAIASQGDFALMPRLGRLRTQHPEIDMRILSSVHPVDFQREGVDVAIRLGTGPYPGMKADMLMDEWFSAVCSPAFRAGTADIVQPTDLLRHPLLHDEMEVRIPDELNWPRWLQAFGVHYARHGWCEFFTHLPDPGSHRRRPGRGHRGRAVYCQLFAFRPLGVCVGTACA